MELALKYIKQAVEDENNRKSGFMLGYAETIQRLQSITIAAPYNIHQIKSMSRNNLYTAISRTKTWDSIGIEWCDKTFKFEEQPVSKFVPKPEVKKGEIYKMWDDEGEYYGKSDDAKRREQEHYDNPNEPAKMKAWLAKGKKNFKSVESVWYMDENELRRLERSYIARMDPERSMNTQCVVRKAIGEQRVVDVKIECDRFIITDDTKRGEWRIQWREDGKAKQKAWRYNCYNYRNKEEEAEKFKRELVKKFYR